MINIAILGCGRIARDFHIPSILSLEDVRLTSLCDTNPTSLGRAAKLAPKAQIFDSPEKFLESKSPDIVDICTPGFTHHSLAIRSLELGHDVVVEKPAALSLDQTKQIESVRRRAGRQVCVVQSLRYHPNVQQLMSNLRQMRLGRPVKVSCIHHGTNIHNEPSWLHNEDQSGALVYELAIHLIDLMAVLLGTPREIVGINIHFSPELNLTTAIESIISFQEGGIGILDLAQDTTLHSAMHSQASVYCTGADAFLKFSPDYIRISSGQVDPLQETIAETRRLLDFGTKIIGRRYRYSRTLPHRTIIGQFVKSIASGLESPVPLRSIYDTMALADSLWLEAKRKKSTRP